MAIYPSGGDMQNDSRTADESRDLTSAQLILRGELLLEALAKEAHAARVEAKRAELQVALASAEAGHVASLEQWMERNDSAYFTPNHPEVREGSKAPSATASKLPSPEFRLEGSSKRPPEGVPQSNPAPWQHPAATHSWGALVPVSQARLELVRASLRKSPGVHPRSGPEAGGSIVQKSATSPGAPERAASRKEGPSRGSWKPLEGAESITTAHRATVAAEKGLTQRGRRHNDKRRTVVKRKKTQDSDSHIAGSPSSARASRESSNGAELAGSKIPLIKSELLAVATSFDAAQCQQQSQKHRKMMLLSGASGLGASLFLHVLIVIALMIITLKLPSSTASLTFESSVSESMEETLELTQPTEISVSEVSPEASRDDVTNFADSLSAMNTLTSEILTDESLLPRSSLASLASSAATALSIGKPNPAHANASFFGASASGNCFCYVIDGSESMRGGPWEAAKAELLRSLDTLKEKQRFYIVFFNREISAISLPGEREPAASPLYATKENINHARRWIETLRIAPGAPPNKALKFAIEREPDAIYLLTDGVTKVDVAEFLRSNNRTHDFINGEQVMVPIHAIAYYSLMGETLMRRIASENKGEFIYVPQPGKR
jgi:hypothetical protein